MIKAISVLLVLFLGTSGIAFAQGSGAASTQTNDNRFNRATPWADARANGAVCDGTTDDTNALVKAFSSVGTNGNEFRIEDNCNLAAPPSRLSTPAYWVTLHLGGRFKIGATLALAPRTCLDGSMSERGPSRFFGNLPTADVIPSSPQISPLLRMPDSGPVCVKNITLNNGGGWAGIGIQATNVADVILENVVAESWSDSARPFVYTGSFGLRVTDSEFAPGPGSTNPAILLQDNAANGDPTRAAVFKNVFSNYQGA